MTHRVGDGEVHIDGWLRTMGRRIRILRLTRELTQDELAAASGLSRSFVSQLEQGAHGIDVVRLLRLAVALDVPLADLLGPDPHRG